MRTWTMAAAAVAMGTALGACTSRDACGPSRRAAPGGAPAACAAPSPLPPGTSWRAPSEPSSTEAYASRVENDFVRASEEPLSTFAVDVDTASYANVRRFLNEGTPPPEGAVRVEEMLNYFPYHVAPPTDGSAFAARVDAAGCPWAPTHRLVRVALKGREIARATRPPMNLVMLCDVSGSMNEPNKLPLVKESMRMLADELDGRDRISIVVYAGSEGLALPTTTGDRRRDIRRAIDHLAPGGSTNGAAGIRLAYQLAEAAFVPGGVNRVVLATDGDFNVGVTSESDLVDLVTKKAKSGVFLTVLGYGMGNYKDSTLEALADKGNGNYGYVDGVREARKILVDQAASTLVTIAKDVKIQVEFNPAVVESYRLVGYENRLLRKQDFNDDAKDAGEVGAGHTVTALYEVVPAAETVATPRVDPLRYGIVSPKATTAAEHGAETLLVKLRWKEPEGTVSKKVEIPFVDAGATFDAAEDDFRFAAAVAEFGMCLTASPHKGTATLSDARRIARSALGDDPGGWRAEMVGLLQKAESLPEAASR